MGLSAISLQLIVQFGFNLENCPQVKSRSSFRSTFFDRLPMDYGCLLFMYRFDLTHHTKGRLLIRLVLCLESTVFRK